MSSRPTDAPPARPGPGEPTVGGELALGAPVGRARVADEIVRRLRGLILRGEVGVGEKLPPERQLAARLGVNRTSLREALKRLELLGLVRTRQGDGTRVLDFMQTAGLDLLTHLFADPREAGPALLRDALELRVWFGRESARLAALRSSPEDRAALARLAERAHALDGAELLRLDLDFYVALTQAGRNAVFTLLINTIRPAVREAAGAFAALNPPAEVVRLHHAELLAALEAGDALQAARIAEAYLARPLERLTG